MSKTEEEARVEALLTRLDTGMATNEEVQRAFATLLRMMWSKEDLAKMVKEILDGACENCKGKTSIGGVVSRVIVLPWFWGFLCVAIFSPNFPLLVDFVKNIIK